MPKTAIREKPKTLGQAIDQLFYRNYRDCSHEREISEEIQLAVRRVLEEFGVLGHRPILQIRLIAHFAGLRRRGQFMPLGASMHGHGKSNREYVYEIAMQKLSMA